MNYKKGWMGLRSVPRTLDDGYCCAERLSRRSNIGKDKSPNSMAQIPVPVAMSRTFWGSVRGAICSESSMVMTNK
jgi:hypothetical protein